MVEDGEKIKFLSGGKLGPIFTMDLTNIYQILQISKCVLKWPVIKVFQGAHFSKVDITLLQN